MAGDWELIDCLSVLGSPVVAFLDLLQLIAVLMVVSHIYAGPLDERLDILMLLGLVFECSWIPLTIASVDVSAPLGGSVGLLTITTGREANIGGRVDIHVVSHVFDGDWRVHVTAVLVHRGVRTGGRTNAASTAHISLQTACTPVLLDHKVNRLLSIVQIELVVLCFFLLLASQDVLFLQLLGPSSTLQADWWTKGSFRLDKSGLVRPAHISVEFLSHARLERFVSMPGVLGRARLRKVVQEHERGVDLRLFAQSFVEEIYTFVIFVFQLALYALVLDVLQLLLFVDGCLLQQSRWQCGSVEHRGCLLD